jgi:hypothetical protein
MSDPETRGSARKSKIALSFMMATSNYLRRDGQLSTQEYCSYDGKETYNVHPVSQQTVNFGNGHHKSHKREETEKSG